MKIRLAILLILVVLFPLGYSVISAIVTRGAAPGDLFLERPDPKHDRCVRETEYMRFHHWELLREIREKVVRSGIREEISLSRCKECHTSRERFCDQCHNAVSLTPDCFGCHYFP